MVSKVAQVINFPLSKEDVDIAHRLPKRKNNTPPAIVLKFVRRSVKFDFMKKWKQASPTVASFGGTGSDRVYVSDHLATRTKELFFEARKLKKTCGYKYVWTRDSKIFVRKTDTSKTVQVRDFNTVDDLINRDGTGQRHSVANRSSVDGSFNDGN